MILAQPSKGRQRLFKLASSDLQLRLGYSNGNISLGGRFVGLAQQAVALTIVLHLLRSSGSNQVIDQRQFSMRCGFFQQPQR